MYIGFWDYVETIHFFSNLFHFKDETDRYGFNVGRRDEKLPVSRPSQLTPSITVLK